MSQQAPEHEVQSYRLRNWLMLSSTLKSMQSYRDAMDYNRLMMTFFENESLSGTRSEPASAKLRKIEQNHKQQRFYTFAHGHFRSH